MILRGQSQLGGMGAKIILKLHKHALPVPHTFWTSMDLPIIESQ